MRFPEAKANEDYAALISQGVEAGIAHETVELSRLRGEYIPKEEYRPSRVFSIVGSDDQKRIARLAHVKDMHDNDPDKFDQYKRQAIAAGVDITGKGYSSGIAAYPGDPDAWYKDDHDLKEKAKLKGGHVGKEDGLLKINMPISMKEKSHGQMLKKPRIHKPTMLHRRNIELQRKQK